MNILRSDVLQIDVVDPRAVVHVVLHPGLSRDEIEFQLRMSGQFLTVAGTPRKIADPQFSESFKALRIMKFYFLCDLKKPRAARDPDGLERRRYCQADRLFCPAAVCHHKISRQRVQAALIAFHRGVERFKIYGRIGPLSCRFGHSLSLPFLFALAVSVPQRGIASSHPGMLLLFDDRKLQDLFYSLSFSLEVKIVPHRSPLVPPEGKGLPGRCVLTVFHFHKDTCHLFPEALELILIHLRIILRYRSHTLPFILSDPPKHTASVPLSLPDPVPPGSAIQIPARSSCRKPGCKASNPISSKPWSVDQVSFFHRCRFFRFRFRLRFGFFRYLFLLRCRLFRFRFRFNHNRFGHRQLRCQFRFFRKRLRLRGTVLRGTVLLRIHEVNEDLPESLLLGDADLLVLH